MKPSNLFAPLFGFLASAAIVAAAPPSDWLIEPAPFKARVLLSKDGREVEFAVNDANRGASGLFATDGSKLPITVLRQAGRA